MEDQAAGASVLRHVAAAAPADEAVAVGEEGERAEHCGCEAERVRVALDDACDVGAEVEEQDEGG